MSSAVEPVQLDREHLTQFKQSPSSLRVRRLLFGVLSQALEDFQRKPDTDLIEWFSYDGPGTIFAFRNICELLNLDPDEVRLRVMGRPKD